MYKIINLPPQQLSFSKKNKAWRKKHLDWAESKALFNYSPVRKSVRHKKINYDLLNGKLHMSDLELVLNPEHLSEGFTPDKIQHYPIMNSKLNVLRGEESKRIFDFRVIITNPNAISEIENNKREELIQRIKESISNVEQSEEEFNDELNKINDYYSYEWQDMREIRANALINHYIKEYNLPLLFNEGFVDAMAIGEEIYQCDIVGGEPIINKLDPLKVRIFKSGYSNKIEDADIIIIEDYWNPGKIIDTYYDVLSKKDIEHIEKIANDPSSENSSEEIDERQGFINPSMIDDSFGGEGFYFNPLNLFSDYSSNSLTPYDVNGNVRVLRMYWKSRRKIKKVKSYDPETGEEIYNFYPETYILNTDIGEEEQILYVNEAWEGTKIGSDIYVNMRPRIIQYNRLSNPSRCHFGIIGSIYNLNSNKPFSLVDMMKQYNYLYDVIHDRLNKTMARNWGKILRLDIAKVPKGWDIEKWLYYARINGLAVEDSFKEGDVGASTGRVIGALNNNSSGVIDAEFGNSIQQQINLLEFIKMEMSEVAGITRQREGQISNRETVGGVERATLQSSHITEWLFVQHEDIKKRVIEAFLETAKIALKGRNKKFQHILSDNSLKIMNIDGDEFSEADYGLIVDNSTGVQELSQKLDMLAQAALQNQTLSFSTIMKLYNSSSLAEKQRIVERDEQAIQERNSQIQKQQFESQERIIQMNNELKESELLKKEQANIRDNETKLTIAYINSNNQEDNSEETFSEKDKALLMEKIREFDEKIKLDREKLNHDIKVHEDNIKLKNKQIKTKS